MQELGLRKNVYPFPQSFILDRSGIDLKTKATKTFCHLL